MAVQTPATAAPAASAAPTFEQDQSLLMALIYGVLHETDLESGAEFAVKLAVCAQIAAGDQEIYKQVVKRAMVAENRLVEIFPGIDVKTIIRGYLRVIRRARPDPNAIAWLKAQFLEPQTDDVIKKFLVKAEYYLAQNFIA